MAQLSGCLSGGRGHYGAIFETVAQKLVHLIVTAGLQMHLYPPGAHRNRAER